MRRCTAVSAIYSATSYCCLALITIALFPIPDPDPGSNIATLVPYGDSNLGAVYTESRISPRIYTGISVNFRVELIHLRLDILFMTASSYSYTTGLFSPDSFSPPAVVRRTTEAMTFDE